MKNVVFSNKVYNKDFKIKAVGYDCQEVDTFLDEINNQCAFALVVLTKTVSFDWSRATHQAGVLTTSPIPPFLNDYYILSIN